MHVTTTALLALCLIYSAHHVAGTAAHRNWDPVKHVVKIDETVNVKSKGLKTEVVRYELAEEPVLVQFDRQSCTDLERQRPSCLFYVTNETIKYDDKDGSFFRTFKDIKEYVDGKNMSYFCSQADDYADFHLFVSGTIVNFRSGTRQRHPAFNVTRQIASDGNKAPFIFLAKYDPCAFGSVNVGGIYVREERTMTRKTPEVVPYEKTECPACECKKGTSMP